MFWKYCNLDAAFEVESSQFRLEKSTPRKRTGKKTSSSPPAKKKTKRRIIYVSSDNEEEEEEPQQEKTTNKKDKQAKNPSSTKTKTGFAPPTNGQLRL